MGKNLGVMKIDLGEKIYRLASSLNKPLYAVGGVVRNFLIDGSVSADVDICAPILTSELLPKLKEFGFTVICEYARTGTIVFCDESNRFEYTCFRTESYLGKGEHSPSEIAFTEDIEKDALRRDFRCNAIYYDIAKEEIVDVLNGVGDVKNKILDTVKDANDVFKDDGLRLMRLARLGAELNFEPSTDTKLNAKKYASNIDSIAPERICEELKKMLASDEKYHFSNKKGHYTSLKLLYEIGVLERLFPELTLGANMEQRKDYHAHDVLEHSLRCVLYSPPNIRLAALLHDVGKPYAMINAGNFHGHDAYGVKLAEEILKRLKVSKKETEKVLLLVKDHMLDIKLDMRENKIRRWIAKNSEYFENMMDLKQADFSASKDDFSVAPTVVKWRKIYDDMVKNDLPFGIKDLKIDGNDLVALGAKGKQISEILEKLFDNVLLEQTPNDRAVLLKLAKRHLTK